MAAYTMMFSNDIEKHWRLTWIFFKVTLIAADYNCKIDISPTDLSFYVYGDDETKIPNCELEINNFLYNCRE